MQGILLAATTSNSSNPNLIVGFVLISIVWGIYWAWVCGYVANEKGRNARGWAIAGFFGGLLAFLPIAVVPDISVYEDDPA